MQKMPETEKRRMKGEDEGRVALKSNTREHHRKAQISHIQSSSSRGKGVRVRRKSSNTIMEILENC